MENGASTRTCAALSSLPRTCIAVYALEANWGLRSDVRRRPSPYEGAALASCATEPCENGGARGSCSLTYSLLKRELPVYCSLSTRNYSVAIAAVLLGLGHVLTPDIHFSHPARAKWPPFIEGCPNHALLVGQRQPRAPFGLLLP